MQWHQQWHWYHQNRFSCSGSSNSGASNSNRGTDNAIVNGGSGSCRGGVEVVLDEVVTVVLTGVVAGIAVAGPVAMVVVMKMMKIVAV